MYGAKNDAAIPNELDQAPPCPLTTVGNISNTISYMENNANEIRNLPRRTKNRKYVVAGFPEKRHSISVHILMVLLIFFHLPIKIAHKTVHKTVPKWQPQTVGRFPN